MEGAEIRTFAPVRLKLIGESVNWFTSDTGSEPSKPVADSIMRPSIRSTPSLRGRVELARSRRRFLRDRNMLWFSVRLGVRCSVVQLGDLCGKAIGLF